MTHTAVPSHSAKQTMRWSLTVPAGAEAGRNRHARCPYRCRTSPTLARARDDDRNADPQRGSNWSLPQHEVMLRNINTGVPEANDVVHPIAVQIRELARIVDIAAPAGGGTKLRKLESRCRKMPISRGE